MLRLIIVIKIALVFTSCADNLSYKMSGLFSSNKILSSSEESITTANPFFPNISLNAQSEYDSILWTKKSGPGNIIFSDINSLNPKISASKAGVYEAHVLIKFKDGSSASKVVKFEWIEVDSNPPEAFTITNPANGETTQTTINFTWSEAQDVSQVTYKIFIYDSSCNAEIFPSETNDLSFNLTSATLSPATNYCLKIEAKDEKGFKTLSSNSPLYFTTDVLSISSPTSKAANISDGYLNNSEKAVGSMLVLAPTGSYDKVFYSMKAGVHASCDASFGSYSETIPTSTDVGSDGDYTICSYVSDNAGGDKVYDSPITFTADFSAPDPVTTSEWNGSPTYNTDGSLTVNWTASPSSDIAGYRLEVYSDASCSTIDGTATTVSSSTFTANHTASVDGDYYFKVIPVDTAGNENAPSVCSIATKITVDTTAPNAASSLSWDEGAVHNSQYKCKLERFFIK